MKIDLKLARAGNGLLRCAAILLTALWFNHSLARDEVISLVYPVINNALFITIAAFLMLPLTGKALTPLINGLLACLLFLLLHLLTSVGAIPIQLLFQTTLIILCLSLLLGSLARWLTRPGSGRVSPQLPVLTLALLAAGSPVWLGPLVELSQPGETLINAIIAISPLTHFSVALEYDFLRSEWMYNNTPFGSLHFTYPGLVTILCVYLVLVILIQFLLYRYPGGECQSPLSPDSLSVS